MPPDRGDRAALWDMLHYVSQVVETTTRRTFEQYMADADFRLATERRIEIVGEAARRVSAQLKKQHPEIPWRSIMAQRHILAHEYGEVIHEKIWRVATFHLPALILQLEPLVPQPPASE